MAKTKKMASLLRSAAPAVAGAVLFAAQPAEAKIPVVEAPETAPVTDSILDIPVVKQPRQQRKVSTQDAEQILGSVLEALPEPKQPGQGRSHVSRRAGSAGQVVSAPSE